MHLKTILKNFYHKHSSNRVVIAMVSMAIVVSIIFFNFSETLRNKKKKILVINHQRFRESIEKLNNDDVSFIKMPLFWQFFLIGNFSKELDPLGADYFYNLKSPLHIKVQDFLIMHFNIIFKFFNFDGIISANFQYKQDIDFSEIFKKMDKKYIILQEENVGIIPAHVEAFSKRAKKFEPSKADLILTYNLTTRNALVNAGFIDSKKIFATGCLRYSDIKKKFKKNIKQTNNKNIIFFSFQHNSIIDNDPKEIYEKMPAFGKRGLVNFFKNSHNLIINLAQNEPNIKVKIKLKWPGKWKKTILENWKEFSGNDNLPRNCEIIYTNFKSEIFENADLIISWVSTTILESFLLDKPVLIPKFDEAKEKYDEFIDLTEYEKTCIICENKDLFINQVKKYLSISNVNDEIMSERKKLINKYLTTDTSKMIEETKKRIIETLAK